MPRGACGRQVLACRGPDTKNVDKTRPAMNREREKEKEKRGIKSRVAREATSQARKRKDDLMAIRTRVPGRLHATCLCILSLISRVLELLMLSQLGKQ